MFRKLKYTYEEWGLKTNICKNENSIISKIKYILLNNINIKKVDEFKYLESITH